jgi:hypothetical protein
MHLGQAVRYYFGFSGVTSNDMYWLGEYFQPQVLVRYVIGTARDWYAPETSFISFNVEAAKWCIVFAIAVWLSTAQFLAWRRGRKGKAA